MKASNYSIESISTYGLETFVLTIITVDKTLISRQFMSRQGALSAWLKHLNQYN